MVSKPFQQSIRRILCGKGGGGAYTYNIHTYTQSVQDVLQQIIFVIRSL